METVSKNLYDGSKVNMYMCDEYGLFGNRNCKVFKIGKLFYLYRSKSTFWFRIFGGYGIWGRNAKDISLELFSERIGRTKYLKIFGWKLKILKPFNPFK